MKKFYLLPATLIVIGVIYLGSTEVLSQSQTTDSLLSEESETMTVPLGLPLIPWPKDNPYTKKKAELGRLLYFDKRLSSNGTVSCATCHSIPRAFADNKPIAEGILNRKGTRHSPTVINAAYQTHYFWDGRAASLEEQCKGPLGNPKEMTLLNNVHEAHEQCQERIQSIPGYRALFKEVFGDDDITLDEIAKAIATFERTILSGNSAYDRYVAGDHSAMTKDQLAGMKVFKFKGCINCHNGPNFTDGRFLNIGVGMDTANPDLGRYLITKNDKDWGAFKVPTLREVTRTKPYMHDGSISTLDGVIEYYDKGGNSNRNLHPLMHPLHLTLEEKNNLRSFMEALDGEGWQHFTEPTQYP